MQMLQEEEKKKENGQVSGLLSILRVHKYTQQQLHKRLVRINQTKRFALLYYRRQLRLRTYIHTYIEKVRNASFVMVKTDNSINHIFTCTKKNLSKSFYFYLFVCDYLLLFYKKIKRKIEVDVICKKDICFGDELMEEKGRP